MGQPLDFKSVNAPSFYNRFSDEETCYEYPPVQNGTEKNIPVKNVVIKDTSKGSTLIRGSAYGVNMMKARPLAACLTK